MSDAAPPSTADEIVGFSTAREVLRHLVEQAPVALAMLDTELRYLAASARWHRDYDLGETPLEGRSHYEVFPDLPHHWKGVHQRCLEGAVERAEEDVFQRGDGTKRWVRWEVQPWRCDEDRVGGLLIFTEDITSQKATEQHAKLALLRAELGSILSHAGTLTHVLAGAAQALVAHLGVPFFRIWTLNEATAVLELRASAGMYTHINGPNDRIPLGHLRIGQIASTATPYVTNAVPTEADMCDPEWAKREGMAAFAGYPLVVDGRVVGVMATFARRPLEPSVLDDLAAVADAVAQCVVRKRSEESLRASEARLQMMMDNAQHGLWEWDIETGAEGADERWFGILGYQRSDVVATYQFWEESIHPDDKSRVLAVLNAHLNSQSSLYDVDYRARTKTGEWIWVNTRGRVSARDAAGKPLRMMGTIHDITARKQAEQQQRELELQLQQAQRLESLGILAGGIAHDFNNLLMVVGASASLAQEANAQGLKITKELQAIETAAQQAAALTNQMLAYAGKSPIVRRVVSLDRVVGEMSTLLNAAVSKKASLELVLDPVVVEGDAAQLQQVAMNLVTNASEALHDQTGTIQLRTHTEEVRAETLRPVASSVPLAEGLYACLAVSDTGHGMDPGTVERIFDPFFTTKFTGRGLGLAAVLGIVRGHGGAVLVDSTPGHGSTFRILLPLAHSEPPARPGAPAVVEATRQGTVLVVDDEPMVRRVLHRVLTRAGYAVLEAADGREAVTVCGASGAKVDAVLLDVTMPHMDGIEALGRLHDVAPGLPVLLMTGYATADLAERVSGRQPTRFLHKPFAANELVKALREVLATAN